MTVYVVPCGVSLLDVLTANKPRWPVNAKPAELVNGASDWGRAVLGLADDEVLSWWSRTATSATRDARLAAWDPRVLCAETSTLAASSGLSDLKGLPGRGDTILVLASDTERGVVAALSVAQYIAGADLPGVRYLSTAKHISSASPGFALERGKLTVLRLRKLDPVHAKGGFIDAIAGLGQALRAAFDLGEPMEVHLTGGYKATLLYTMALTELLYSLAPDRVSARYLFEDTQGAATTIGLRQFSRPICDDMRAELVALRDGKKYAGAVTFENLVWDRKAKKFNAFGYGYLAVLGEPFPSSGPGPLGS